jgi:hypothetical protein
MRLTLKLMTVVIVMFITCALCAQDAGVVAKPLTDNDISLLRKDIQKSKVEIITDNMQFSKAEADAFWPIYKNYAAEQQAINETRFAIVMDYAKGLEKMDSAMAHDLTVRSMKIEEDTLALKRKFFPKFEAAIGGKLAAKFVQIDNRMTAIVNMQLASEIPVIP